MPSIPLDVLLEILKYVREADLPTLCKVNKIFCSCSRDVLYRKIYHVHNRDKCVIQTLAQTTDLARRVRSVGVFGSFVTVLSVSGGLCECPELATALRNMSSLRHLDLDSIGDDASVLDGCTFKLDSFRTTFPYCESLQQFLNNQSSLTEIILFKDYESLPPLGERCLPNLIQVWARPSWLGILIPGRSVREVNMFSPSVLHSTDLSYFTLSTTPVQKLKIDYDMLYLKPVSLLVSIFPTLVHLVVWSRDREWTVCVPLSNR
jgi:F-box domain